MEAFAPTIKNVSTANPDEKKQETNRSSNEPEAVSDIKLSKLKEENPLKLLNPFTLNSKPGTPGTWRGNKRVEDYAPPYHPYIGEDGEFTGQPSDRAITKWLGDRRNFSDPRHPYVWQPNLGTNFVQIPWVGHERNDRGSRPAGALRAFEEKRAGQRAERDSILKNPAANGIMRGVKAYINGHLVGTTDIYMKKLVEDAGGSIIPTQSGATHILTSNGLNPAKSKRYFAMHSKDRPHVVKPQWVFDSVEQGKRLPEWDYNLMKDTRERTLGNMFANPPSLAPALASTSERKAGKVRPAPYFRK